MGTACLTYSLSSSRNDGQVFILEGIEDCVHLSSEGAFSSLFIWKYVLVSRYIKYRDKPNKQLKAWILPLIFNRLEMSWNNVKLLRQLLSGYTSGLTGFFNGLPQCHKVKVFCIFAQFAHHLYLVVLTYLLYRNMSSD